MSRDWERRCGTSSSKPCLLNLCGIPKYQDSITKNKFETEFALGSVTIPFFRVWSNFVYIDKLCFGNDLGA